MTATKRVVLVGGGHAHLYVAARKERFAARDVEVLLIDPEDFWYSGLATGVLGGRYEPDEGKVDLQRMSRARGFTYLRDRVTGVDVQTRTIRLEASEEIAWSAISFNVGSVVGDAGIEGAAHATAAKPIRGPPPR